jgi:Flp pilus assembly protein TadG
VIPQSLGYSSLRAIARLAHDEGGVSATILAMALPVLLGVAALDAETGAWYLIKLQNQSAADAAAISAAYETIAGKTNVAGDLIAAASEAATQNGYTGTAPAVVYPYSDSTVSNAVSVTLHQTQRGMFASLFLPSVTIATQAVAVIKPLDNPCILALAKTGTGVEFGNFSSLDTSGCAVGANSTSANAIDAGPNAVSITAATLVTSGGITLNGNPVDPAAPPSEFILTSRLLIGASTIADPYASRLTHASLTSGMPPDCAAGPPYPANSQICGGLSIKNAMDLVPGTYWITDGSLQIQTNAVLNCSSCASANGTGVTIILTTKNPATGAVGNVEISGGATVTLQAPNSGPFSGLLLIQDPLASSAGSGEPDNTLEGGPTMSLTGLLYFPNTSVGLQGNPRATCTILVVNQVEIDGTSRFTNSGCATAGLKWLPKVYTVTLAE